MHQRRPAGQEPSEWVELREFLGAPAGLHPREVVVEEALAILAVAGFIPRLIAHRIERVDDQPIGSLGMCRGEQSTGKRPVLGTKQRRVIGSDSVQDHTQVLRQDLQRRQIVRRQAIREPAASAINDD